MYLLQKIKPTLVFDGKNTEKQILELESLKNLDVEGEKIRDKELKLLNIGLQGEKQILYELLHSNIPMYIFHDVYYEYEDLKAQIDFIVVTEYKVFIIECKNVIGNIIINNDGNFIREYNGIKEGMYSPVTQNQRHIDIIKNLFYSRQKLLFKILNRNVNYFDSMIVFTNPKSLIKNTYAPKDIKNKVMRADAVISHIKKIIEKQQEKTIDLDSFTNFFKFHNKPSIKDNISKYNKYIKTTDKIKNISINKICEELKQFRLDAAKEEGNKPYFIFTNEELNMILEILPETKEQLLNIKGFGTYKTNKYGDKILDIIRKYK